MKDDRDILTMSMVICITILAILFASWWCENLQSVSVDSAFIFFFCAAVVWGISQEGSKGTWILLLPWAGAIYFLMFLLAPEEGKGVLVNLSFFCEVGGFLVILGFMLFEMATSKKQEEFIPFVYDGIDKL
ncbi:MAG: hypothetical protein Q8N55_01730 [bacterium]|nr:hypothetical protein [bacterium]